MRKSSTRYVGLNVHKDSIDIAAPRPGATARFGTWAASAAIWPRRTRACASSSARAARCTSCTKPGPAALSSEDWFGCTCGRALVDDLERLACDWHGPVESAADASALSGEVTGVGLLPVLK